MSAYGWWKAHEEQISDWGVCVGGGVPFLNKMYANLDMLGVSMLDRV
jgi:hypothetical protein